MHGIDWHLLQDYSSTSLLYLISTGGRMVCVSQSAALLSLLAAPTLATSSALSWTTTAAARVNTVTTSAEAKFLQTMIQ